MTALLTLDFPPEHGGIQRYLYDRVRHLYSAADSVIVGRGAPPAVGAPVVPCAMAVAGNPLSRINKKWSIINLFFCALAVTRDRGVCLECGNVYAAIAAWLVSRVRRSVRYRVYVYGGELVGLRRRSLMALLLRGVLRRAESLYALGSYTERLLRQAGIETSVSIEPPRIDLPRDAGVRPVRTIREMTRSAPLALLCVGRLVPHKGHATLIEACHRLPAELPWRLTIVGSGPLQRQLERSVKMRGLDERVFVRTDCDDHALDEAYRGADLFVFPSLEQPQGTEGFGIAMLDAMARGVPIVASRAGGIPEVLDNGACGVLVEPNDATALAGAIVALAGDPAQRERLAQRAFERLKERYVWR